MSKTVETQFTDLVTEAKGRGYAPFSNHMLSGNEGYLGSLQRRVRDGMNTLYFINVDVFDLGRASQGKIPEQMMSSASVQFTTENGHGGSVVDVRVNFEGFDEVESIFDDMFRKMEFRMYEVQDQPVIGL